MNKDIKKQLKFKISILQTLDRPIAGTSYSRNEEDISRKRALLLKEIRELEEKLKTYEP